MTPNQTAPCEAVAAAARTPEITLAEEILGFMQAQVPAMDAYDVEEIAELEVGVSLIVAAALSSPCDRGEGAYKVTVGPDAANTNNRRLFVDGQQWAKVYGWDDESVEARCEILAAHLARPTLPEGWVAVPVEATDEMIEAAYNEWLNSGALSGRDVIREIFRAMLSALPLPFGGGEVIGSRQLSAKASVPGEPVTANVDDREAG